VAWEVEASDRFSAWWDTLDSAERESVAHVVDLLEIEGPMLPFPYSSKVNGSKFGVMRELRIQHEGRPYRVLYAFDPKRAAFLILGGDKTGDDRWYERNVAIADSEWEEHLKEIGIG